MTVPFRFSKERLLTLFDIVFSTVTIFIVNRRTWLCMSEIDKPLFFCQYGSLQDELVILVALVIVAWLILWYLKEFGNAVKLWKKNWLLIIFLVFVMLSLTWTVDIRGSTLKIIQLVFTTLLASYFGIRYSNKQLLNGLFIFSFFIVFFSFLLVIVLPGAAIMSTYPHEGFWRGVTSHRNYLGSLAAFSSVISLITIAVDKRIGQRILAALVFMGCGYLIYKSGSATGLLLMAGLTFLFLIYLGWVYLWPKFKKWLKIGILSLGSLLIIIASINMGKIFALVGRSSSLTGRIPLWKYLIQDVASHNLWLGYGLGTVWFQSDYQVKLAEALGWPFLIVNGHNGFIDTLVCLGLIGLILLIGIVLISLIRSIIHLVKNKTFFSFLPFISIVYVIVANLTISFFFEFETFHWTLLVCFLFALTALTSSRKIEIQP